MATERREKVWAIADQALNSLSNLLGSVLAARLLSPAGFGTFSVAFAAYVLSLGVSRAWTSEPMVILYADETAPMHAIRRAAGGAVVVGCAAGLIVSMVGLIAGGAVRTTAVVLAVSLPLLLLQDLWRFALVMLRRPAAAAMNDLVWVLALVVLFVGLGTTDHPTPGGAVAVWALGGAIAALVGAVQIKCLPWFTTRTWIHTVRHLSVRFTGEFMLIAGSGYIILLLIAAAGDVTQAAAFRGAQLALSPLNILFLGASLQLLPQMVRSRGSDATSIARMARRASAFLAACAVLWGALATLIPTKLGESLIGDSWPNAKPIIPLWAWYYVASGSTIGASTGLRALGAASSSLRARLLVNPLALVLGALGFWTFGAKGAVAGLALGATIGLPVWWRLLRKETDGYVPGSRALGSHASERVVAP